MVRHVIYKLVGKNVVFQMGVNLCDHREAPHGHSGMYTPVKNGVQDGNPGGGGGNPAFVLVHYVLMCVRGLLACFYSCRPPAPLKGEFLQYSCLDTRYILVRRLRTPGPALWSPVLTVLHK